MFLIGLTGNLAAWLVAFFAPGFLVDATGLIGEVTSTLEKLLWAVPIFFGATTAFPFFKYLCRKGDRRIVAENEFMGGYAENLKRSNLRRVFFASLGCGGINTIVLALAVIWFR